jgi:hypothetical protein
LSLIERKFDREKVSNSPRGTHCSSLLSFSLSLSPLPLALLSQCRRRTVATLVFIARSLGTSSMWLLWNRKGARTNELACFSL